MQVTKVTIRLVESGKIRANATVTFDDELVCCNYRVIEGKDGIFATFPNFNTKGRWCDIVFPKTKELRKDILDKIIMTYNETVELALQNPDTKKFISIFTPPIKLVFWEERRKILFDMIEGIEINSQG